MKYNPASIERYLSYLSTYDMQREGTILLPHTANYDFELEHKLVEQCEAGDFIHAVESPIRDTE
jgi:hypothetical protein